MWCAHQIINYVHCNLILAGAVPSNVIQPRKCLVQSNLIKSRMNILITSVSACPPLFSLVAKSHSFLQFLGENQDAARLPPIIFHPALFAPRTSFLHSRENSFWICGESGTSPIWYSAYSQRNGPGLWWAKLCLCVCVLVCLCACGRSCACSVNNNLRYVAAALFPCWGQNVLVLSTNVFML